MQREQFKQSPIQVQSFKYPEGPESSRSNLVSKAGSTLADLMCLGKSSTAPALLKPKNAHFALCSVLE